MMDRDEFRAVSVLVGDWPAYDLADHLADVMPETLPDGRYIWDMSAEDLARLSVDHYPGGAVGLQLALMGLGCEDRPSQPTVPRFGGGFVVRDQRSCVPSWWGYRTRLW
ncbi:hypothetical protein [Mycobacterium pseudokansasii]|uniref:Uncharacterized protein n=1 Tax=Mycobacterium pseudokansasii TaxID=2341080 RepID=A0A498R2C1_9MYCO|nr:hypothetical protein [Mycobacterium pseudokansasii]VBA56016.1 hypothetical protein LAUMK142_05348 [Mycobacterium pseudokansasii]